MRVTISSGLIERIIALASASPAHEICGLLTGAPDCIAGLVETENVAADRSRAFEVDPAAQFAAIKAGRVGAAKVIGCYHSHPSGSLVPSDCDRTMIGKIGDLWLITDGVTVRCWRASTLTSFAEVELVETTAGCAAS